MISEPGDFTLQFDEAFYSLTPCEWGFSLIVSSHDGIQTPILWNGGARSAGEFTDLKREEILLLSLNCPRSSRWRGSAHSVVSRQKTRRLEPINVGALNGDVGFLNL